EQDVRHERDQDGALDRERPADVLLEARELGDGAVLREGRQHAVGGSRDGGHSRHGDGSGDVQARGGGGGRDADGFRSDGGFRGDGGLRGDYGRRGGGRPRDGGRSREGSGLLGGPVQRQHRMPGLVVVGRNGHTGRFGFRRAAGAAGKISEHAVEDLGRVSVRRGRLFVFPP